MFKFLSFRIISRDKVIPFDNPEWKIDWNIRSINSVLPEKQIKNPHPKIKF